MEHAQEILIIILASVLTIFLLVAITLLVLVIKVVKTVQRVTQKAEFLADKAEAVGEFVQHAATPMIIGRALSKVADAMFSRSSKSKRK